MYFASVIKKEFQCLAVKECRVLDIVERMHSQIIVLPRRICEKRLGSKNSTWFVIRIIGPSQYSRVCKKMDIKALHVSLPGELF